MNLVISDAIRVKYPELRIGLVLAQDVSNMSYQEGLEKFVQQTFTKFVHKFESPKDLDDNKNILAWQEIYRSFGINPKKKKPTAESLLARAIRSNYVPHINAAVDAYLCAETLYYLPIGGYDLTKITGDIVLKLAAGGEEFMGVGSEALEYTNEGEVIYADDARVLTRCWNYRDCDYSKIDNDTTTLALFCEAPLAEISDDEVKGTIDQIAENLQRFCGAKCKPMFLTSQQNKLTII